MPSSPRDPRVFRAQLELVYRLSERSLLASFVLSSILLLFYFEPQDRWLAAAWWVGLNLTAAVRVYLGRQFLGNGFPQWSLDRWARTINAGTLVLGCLWGFFLAVLSPPWGHPAYPISGFIAAGIPAVSLLSNAALFSSYLCVLIPTLGSYALRQIVWNHGSTFESLGGVAALIYLLLLIGVGHAINRRIVQAFGLRFGNDDLVERLKALNTELAAEVARREETERGLREATAVAEAANATKSRFLARMSHEIRTPLNGILGMTEILKQTTLAPQQFAHAETIEEAGRSLLRVINDILDFSRVEAGHLSLQSDDFSVRDVVDRSVALLRPKAIAKGLRIEVEIAAAIPSRQPGEPDDHRRVPPATGVYFEEAMDGEEAVRSEQRLPIVAVTASALAPDRDRAIASGMNDYLSKPFSLTDLHRTMTPFLGSAEIKA